MTSVVISTRWDAATRQTVNLTPASAFSVLVEWDIDPPPVDAAVPDDIAKTMVETLTALGQVAFRWSGEPAWPVTQARIIAAPSGSLWQRAVETAARAWAADVVVTRSAQVAIKLFDFDWDMQGQAVLVLEPAAGDSQPTLERLSRARTWRDFKLEPPVIALMTPIVDGGGAVIATPSAQSRTRIIEMAAAAFKAAGIAVRQ